MEASSAEEGALLTLRLLRFLRPAGKPMALDSEMVNYAASTTLIHLRGGRVLTRRPQGGTVKGKQQRVQKLPASCVYTSLRKQAK